MKARIRIAIMGLLTFSLLAGIAVNAQSSTETYGPEKGWLMLEGGGSPEPPGMLQHFLSLAGGPQANIVYITTAGGHIRKEEAEAEFMGDKNITQLDTHDRAVADSEAYVGALRKATGVWIEGGGEGALVETYVGTRTQKEIEALLARGGVVGGGSAGAIVQGAMSLQPGGAGFEECSNPSCPERRAFGLIHNVFIIPHVIQRGSENFMAQGMAIYPGLLGIGVDAGAAVVVHGNQCEVIGISKVLLPDGSKGKGYEELSAGDRFDLVQAMKRMGVLVDAKTKTETIDALRKDLRESYVYPEMGDKLAAMLEKHQEHGGYNSVTNSKEFIELINRQMSDMAHDPHLHLHYRAQVGGPMGPPPPPDYGFADVKPIGEGRIGYLNLLEFSGDMDNAGPVAAGAMAVLANTRALIIDLRENEGGSPGMVEFLASYFFDHPVHMNDIDFRKPGTKDYRVEQRWTLPYVPGQRYLNKNVYILTSPHTASAAEEFAYDLQAEKRATVVGEATWGGANPGDDMSLGEHFMVNMPTGHSVNPITHTNWEGVGVKPDIEVPLVGDPLFIAIKTELEGGGELTPQAIHLSADVLQTFIGKYQAAPPVGAPKGTPLPILVITANPDGLVLSMGEGDNHTFLPSSPKGEFFSQEEPDVHLIFNKSSSGKVTGFTSNYPSLQQATKLP